MPPSATPLLVVDVLSPSNPDQDRLLKRALYESLGVPAYWIVVPQVPLLLALRIQRGRYEVAGEEAFTTPGPSLSGSSPGTLFGRTRQPSSAVTGCGRIGP
ncbi:MAG: Uma2 family endonuclease [Acidimicrobiales bacterium]